MQRLLLTIIVFFVGNVFLFAETNGASNSKRIKVEVEVKNKRISDRPKAPSMQKIECYYDGQKFEIEFLIPEGNCRFVLRDIATGDFFEQSFSSIGKNNEYNISGRHAFSYYIDPEYEDSVLDEYGIRDWVENLPIRKISTTTLSNSYTIIGI